MLYYIEIIFRVNCIRINKAKLLVFFVILISLEESVTIADILLPAELLNNEWDITCTMTSYTKRIPMITRDSQYTHEASHTESYYHLYHHVHT